LDLCPASAAQPPHIFFFSFFPKTLHFTCCIHLLSASNSASPRSPSIVPGVSLPRRLISPVPPLCNPLYDALQTGGVPLRTWHNPSPPASTRSWVHELTPRRHCVEDSPPPDPPSLFLSTVRTSERTSFSSRSAVVNRSSRPLAPPRLCCLRV